MFKSLKHSIYKWYKLKSLTRRFKAHFDATDSHMGIYIASHCNYVRMPNYMKPEYEWWR